MKLNEQMVLHHYTIVAMSKHGRGQKISAFIAIAALTRETANQSCRMF